MCHQCPYEAKCDNGIKFSKGNYWGFVTSSIQLNYYHVLSPTAVLHLLNAHQSIRAHRIARAFFVVIMLLDIPIRCLVMVDALQLIRAINRRFQSRSVVSCIFKRDNLSNDGILSWNRWIRHGVRNHQNHLLFYQVASLVRINTSSKQEYNFLLSHKFYLCFSTLKIDTGS